MKALTWQSRGKITCETVPDGNVSSPSGRKVKASPLQWARM